MTELWTDRLESSLAGYAPDLLLQVAARLLKTRNHWPPDELIERIRDAIGNAPVIDRRLKDLPLAARKILDLIGLSRRPGWQAGPFLPKFGPPGPGAGTGSLPILF